MTNWFTKKRGYSEKRLMHAAIDHLTSAKVLFEENPRCYDSAGYLSQLGIELILKSVLLFYTEKFPDEHSLIKLINRLKEQDLDISLNSEQRKILSKLDKFFKLRYPQPNKPIEIGGDDWNIIEELFCELVSKMPKEMQEDLNGINHKMKDGRILMIKKVKR